MGKRALRIVLDTNWYISASINRNSRRTIYPLFVHPGVQIFYSEQLLSEYETVINRPFFTKYIAPHQAGRFLKLVLPVLSQVIVSSKVDLSRDKKDNFVLALAKDAKADYLITADNDLLVLKKMGRTKIVRMTDFLEEVKLG
jgi:putative PIN family toxin of toxin-antitoxin system